MSLALDQPTSSHVRAVTVRPATATDRPHLAALLAGCSARSLTQRFLTGMAGPVPARLLTHLLLLDRPGGAYLALVGQEAVGHAMWAPVRAADAGGRRAAEIALLVRDDHQGRGVGTALLYALGRGLVEAAVPWVQATTAADNRVVNALVRRRRPGVRPTRDGADLTYLFPTVVAAAT